MKLFIEKSRFRVGAGERKRLWWRTEQTIYLYYQKIIKIRIEKCAFDRLRHRKQHVDWAESKSQGGWVRMCLRELRSQTFSLCSGTESNTVIERSRNHQMKKCTSAFVNFVRRPSVCAQAPKATRWLSGVEITGWWVRTYLRQAQAPKVTRWLSLSKSPGVVIINLSYKSLKICYFFRKFKVSIK